MSSTPQLYALLVGVNRYVSRSVSDLRGCVNDVLAMRSFLQTRLGVPEAHVLLLSADGNEEESNRATRANILAAFNTMIERLQSGDQFFFHYSGHGAQDRSDDPDEADGFDETIVPTDSREDDPSGQPVFDIKDKELARLIHRAESRGAYVTVLMDCCHSGSGTRKAGDPDPNKPLVRRTVVDKRVRPAETILTDDMPLPAVTRTRSGWKIPDTGGHVLLAGCRDEELSHEYLAPDTNQWHGATTYFLLKALQAFRPDMTWQELFDEVQTQVNAVYWRQIPQLEGPGNRRLFGELEAPSEGYLVVQAVEGGGEEPIYVQISGGAPLGLSAGSRIALYPPGSGPLRGSPLATGEVEESSVDHAWARLTSRIEAGEVQIASRVKITAQGYEGVVYPVAVDDERVRAAVQGGGKAVQIQGDEGDGTAEQQSPFLTLTDSADPGALYRVVQEGETFVIQDGSGVQIVNEAQPANEEGALKIARQLEHLAIWNNVRKLRNPSANSLLTDALSVEVVAYSRPAGRSRPRDGVDVSGGDIALVPGQKVWMTVKNESASNLYVSVFSLNPDFGIKRIYPSRSRYETVRPNGKFDLRTLSFTISNPRVTKSKEVIKVFATLDPTSLEVLELPKLNEPPQPEGRTRASGPLAALLNGIRHEGTRDAVLEEDIHDRWIVKQLEFTILAENDVQPLPAGSGSVSLGLNMEAELSKPEDFSGQLVVSSLEQSTRSVGLEEAVALPPGLSSPDAASLFEPLVFGSGTRSVDASPGVLAISAESDQLDQIGPESPLHLELTVEDEADLAGIMAVAFDGEHYFLAGQESEPRTRSLASGGRRMALQIEHLPRPVEGDPGGAPTRDLKRTVRLFLYKIFRQDPPDVGLRRPILDSDGPDYAEVTRADLEGVERVALLVHGFSSDSSWLVQRAWPLLEPFVDYDLVLTFDYETLGTSIEVNGRTLASSLESLGFREPGSPRLDIFCHSMGTQVVRAMIELSDGDAFVDRVIMGGAPNAGTRLAEGKRLIYWLGTFLLNQAGIAPPTIIANWFFRQVMATAVSVEELVPSSAFYDRLNERSGRPAVAYYVQIGLHEAADSPIDWERLFSKTELFKLFDGGLDLILGPNDLLVGESSARAVREGRWADLTVDTLPGHHFEYFLTEPSLAALRHWLETRKGESE